MAVIVTKMPGGVVQIFNPETGKITYKCKSDKAYLKIEAFGGIVKFHNKGAKAIVIGPKTIAEDCTVLKEGDSEFKQALDSVIKSDINFKKENIEKLNQQIAQLSTNLAK